MTTETTPTQTADVTSPIVTDGTPPVVTSPIVEPVAPAAEVDPVTPPVVVEDKNATPKWVQERINELTARRHEAERLAGTERTAREAAEAKAAELLVQMSKGTNPETPPVVALAGKPNMTQEEIDKLVNNRAAELARANDFNKACDNVADTGKKDFKDWDEAIKNLNLVGALGPNTNIDFLETALELKDPHKILHHLGKNLDEAERIVKLPPKKMALEMARIEASMNAPQPPAPPAPISQAPAPVITLGGAAKPGSKSIDDPDLSTEEFMAMRAQQAAERQKRYTR